MVVAHKLSLPPMIPYYIFTVQILVSVVHEQPISLQLVRHLKFARLAIEKWLMETLLLSRDCVTDLRQFLYPRMILNPTW